MGESNVRFVLVRSPLIPSLLCLNVHVCMCTHTCVVMIGLTLCVIVLHGYVHICWYLCNYINIMWQEPGKRFMYFYKRWLFRNVNLIRFNQYSVFYMCACMYLHVDVMYVLYCGFNLLIVILNFSYCTVNRVLWCKSDYLLLLALNQILLHYCL